MFEPCHDSESECEFISRLQSGGRKKGKKKKRRHVLPQIARDPAEHSHNQCVLTTRKGHMGRRTGEAGESIAARCAREVTQESQSVPLLLHKAPVRFGQMGERVVSSGHAVARRASGQPLRN